MATLFLGSDGMIATVRAVWQAAARKLWDTPEPATLAALRQACLKTEGDLEDR
jgi:hypothetical protein